MTDRQHDCPEGQSARSSHESSNVSRGQGTPGDAQAAGPSVRMQHRSAHSTPLHRTVFSGASGPESVDEASSLASRPLSPETEPSRSGLGDEPSPPPSPPLTSPVLAIPRSPAPLSMTHPPVDSATTATT